MKYLLVIFFLLSLTKTYSQKNEKHLVKTVEKVEGKKRREIYLDSNLNVVIEKYFSEEKGNMIVEIIYGNNYDLKITGYKDDTTKQILYEFSRWVGIVKFYQKEEEVNLQYDKNGWNGIQRIRNLAVNYLNGKRNGKLIQVDNGIIGKKDIVVGRIDPRYLKYDIEKFYYSVEKENVFKDYKGLTLNFLDGKLDSLQKSFYINGKIKFSSLYEKGKLINYNSFNSDESIISKIDTKYGISVKNQILNGTILPKEKKYIFWNDQLASCGEIYIKTEELNENSTGQQNYNINDGSNIIALSEFLKINKSLKIMDIKKAFDEKKYLFSDANCIKKIFGVPDYSIYSYKYEDQDDISILPIEIEATENNQGKIEFITDTLNFSSNYYFPLVNYKFYKLERFSNLCLFPEQYFHYDNEDTRKNLPLLRLKNYKIMSHLEKNYSLPSTFNVVNIEEGGSDDSYFFSNSKEEKQQKIDDIIRIMLENLDTYKTIGRSDLYTKKDKNGYNTEYNIYSTNYYRSPFLDYKIIDVIGGPIKILNTDKNKFIKIINRYEIEISDGINLYKFYFDKDRKVGQFVYLVEVSKI